MMHDETLLFYAHSSESRAAEFAHEHGIPKAYASYEELMYDPEIDVVYIGTVADSHVELATMALYHRKPTVVEKPLALSYTDATSLIHLAQEQQCFLMYV